ncbi:MAG: T9SS type A sorting domain-containing protein [Bacteroidetes bacterium]|nr:MAG: T9SS type A sorting domain-containing protein [Bacteroidota bacterium]
MKIKLLLLLCIFLASVSTRAQLNGNYTIGGTAPNYATFTDAVLALQGSGISGPVTFNVRDGVYIEQIVILEITGASAVNRVTFQSENQDSSLVNLQYPASALSTDPNYTLFLDGADWITFRKMTLQRTGAGTYANVIRFANESTNNGFYNNHIEGLYATQSNVNSTLLYSPQASLRDSNLTVMNNRFVNGSYGLTLGGPAPTDRESGGIIENNIFQDNYIRAIGVLYHDSPRIINNLITTSSVSTNFEAIYCNQCVGSTVIERNITFSPAGGDGITVASTVGNIVSPVRVANNFCSIGNGTSSIGIRLLGASGIAVWNNSVHISGTGVNSRCLHVGLADSVSIDVRNNVFMNSGAGMAIEVSANSSDAFTVLDFNDLYSNGFYIGKWGNTQIATFSDWKTSSGLDQNSVSADPNYFSATDLHATSSIINNAGTPIAAVTTDIDGDLRNLTTPDIGADEFTPLTTDVTVLGLNPLNSLPECGDPAKTFSVSIENSGLSSLSSIPLVIEISGAVSMTILDTVPGPLAPSSSINHTFSQAISTLMGGTFNMRIYSSLSSDQYRNNDTAFATRVFYRIPNPPTAASSQPGCTASVGITAVPAVGDEIVWYDSPIGGNIVGVGSILTVPVNSDTMFYAESRDASGPGGCLKIVELNMGSPDGLEIQNLSSVGFDATGWTVRVGNSLTNINGVGTDYWTLGYFNPGEIQYKTDSPSDNYWGSDIAYVDGNHAWVMLLDSFNQVQDFLPIVWTHSEIQAMHTLINGTYVEIGSQWNGDGYYGCGTDSSISRFGSFDNNNVSDFNCEPKGLGSQNVNLNTNFTTCGLGTCGSTRVPVQVTLGTVSFSGLGPDTSFVAPFSYQLDAGSGFVSYQWSDASTGQTLMVSSPDVYWVMVTGSNGCSYIDSVEISISIGIRLLSFSDKIKAYPNPASENLMVEYTGEGINARIVDVNGRLVLEQKMINRSGMSSSNFDLTNIEAGIYFVQITNHEGIHTMKLIVQHPY